MGDYILSLKKKSFKRTENKCVAKQPKQFLFKMFLFLYLRERGREKTGHGVWMGRRRGTS